ncbi:MAG: S1C family serine protease [Planctomycetota bacterium]
MTPALSHAGPRTSGLTPLLAGAALVLASYLVLDRAGVFDPAPSGDPRPVTARGELASSEKMTIEIFEKNSPAVAHITTFYETRGSGGYTATSSGSGFVWDKLGHVVTNYHVVRTADPGVRRSSRPESVLVRFKGQRPYKAEFVRGYPYVDLAVVRISNPPRNLQPMLLGKSADLKVGQAVFAIGNPFGLETSLSTGVISALDRSIITELGVQLTGLIQVDAAINPGNSGGPLLDSAGRLIGMTTAIVSNSGDSAGIGLAVPVDVINKKLPRLLAGKHALRAGLGIQTRGSKYLRNANGYRLVVIVNEVVPGGGAQEAGIRRIAFGSRGEVISGDAIMAINDEVVEVVNDLHRVLDKYEAGKTVTVKLARFDGGRYQISDVNVTLKPLPAN